MMPGLPCQCSMLPWPTRFAAQRVLLWPQPSSVLIDLRLTSHAQGQHAAQLGFTGSATGCGFNIKVPSSLALQHQITRYGRRKLSERMHEIKALEKLCTAAPDNVLGNSCFFRANPNLVGAWIKEEEVLEVRCCVCHSVLLAYKRASRLPAACIVVQTCSCRCNPCTIAASKQNLIQWTTPFVLKALKSDV